MSRDIVIKEDDEVFQKAKNGIVAAQQQFLQNANRAQYEHGSLSL